MPCPDVFRLGRIGAPAKRVGDADPLLRGERDILQHVPAVGLPEAPAFLYDALHRKNSRPEVCGSNAKGGARGARARLLVNGSWLFGGRRTRLRMASGVAGDMDDTADRPSRQRMERMAVDMTALQKRHPALAVIQRAKHPVFARVAGRAAQGFSASDFSR